MKNHVTETSLFCDGWLFTEAPIGTQLHEILHSDKMYPVEIPHDWMIYDVKNLYRTGEGWYKKVFTLTPDDGLYILRFEGVYMDCTVFVNGEKAFEWKYGYSTFEADITPYITDGENTVVVRCVYLDPNTRWYSGAGIYRRVWLRHTPKLHIPSDSVYISAKKGEGALWNVTVETENLPADHSGYVRHYIIDAEGKTVAEGKTAVDNNGALCVISVPSPRLWDPDDPYLYRVRTELYCDSDCTDASDISESVFGFREIAFDNNAGFFINGRPYKLHGVCEHHDLGALGTAVNKTALRRQLTTLIDMGVNSIRTSHNMPAVELVELCDELGIVIIDEAFDMWEGHKTKNDYAGFFPEWHERDVKSWVTRDRNHPCVIMWSIGNEIGDTTTPRGIKVTKILHDLVRVYDKRQNAYTTSGSNHMVNENAQRCGGILDTVGYNYTERLYASHHEKYKNFCIYGSETASTIQSRGIYHFPYEMKAVTHEDHQCSSIFNCTTSWGSPSTEYNITMDRAAKFCAGQYIWTGFDYIGEPTPYDTKNSYFGQIDTAGFAKDSYYAYKAEWIDASRRPFVHITPSYWDFNPGQIIDITMHTNAARSELYYNGNIIGDYVHNHEDGMEITGHWKLPYAPGKLTAIAYDENGVVIARDEIRSFSDPVRITLTPDKYVMNADGRDLIFVAIETADCDGVLVANARNRVNVNVTGAGRLVGLDNGDSTDYEQYKCNSRRLFSGKLLAVIAATDREGAINVSVTSPGLPEASLTLSSVPAAMPSGMDIHDVCELLPESDEIPLRKIELIRDTGSELTKDSPVSRVKVKLYPVNATLRGVEFQAFSSGVKSNIVTIDKTDDGVILTARGDGSFRLRASSDNGTAYPSIISELEYNISGVGALALDPYSSIPGVFSFGESSPFADEAEGGLRFTDGKPYVIFRGIDFGKYGSDEFTVRMMRHHNNTLPFYIYDITDGAEDLVAELYFMPTRAWFTYSEQTYKLPAALTGKHDLKFMFLQPLVFGGFRFTAPDTAYIKHNAADYDVIYGDTYKLDGAAVTGIGNNVTLGYTAMNFGHGADTVTVYGRTRREHDSLQLRVGGEINTVVFECGDYHEVTAPVVGAAGVSDVNLIFLPGCDFDLGWFRFNKKEN